MALEHTAGFRPHVYRESPWYFAIAEFLARFDTLERFPNHDELNALYRERVLPLDLPCLRFVPSVKTRKKRPRGARVDPDALYEGRILTRGEVPTRSDDWHDLFNALAFVSFPRAKRVLHTRQHAITLSRLTPEATHLPNARTREQDALALFDEGGLCIVAPPSLSASMHEVDDGALRRALHARQVQVLPFGHALYEHLVAGLPCPFTATHVVALEAQGLAGVALLDQVDLALAGALADPSLFREPSRARGNSLSALL